MTAALATILTVEDNPIVQQDLRLMLEDAGYLVCPGANDGLEAVEQARLHRPDLILMDIAMPRLDGIAATRRILSERDVPIVALSGRSNAEFLDRATAAGAVRRLVKPFSEGELVTTVADVLAERRRDVDDRHLKVMIDSMFRAGASEREVVAAVEQATGIYAPVLRERSNASSGASPAGHSAANRDTPARSGGRGSGADPARPASAAGTRRLRRLRHGPRRARGGPARARSCGPDIVVLDVNMPELDGIQAARRILDSYDVPIVMLTAYGYGEVISRALDAGVVGFVVKPFAEADLIDALREASGQARDPSGLGHLSRTPPNVNSPTV